MKNSGIILLVILIIMASCAHKTQPSTSTKTTAFYYEKTPCMGACPVYTFTLFEDKSVEFKGTANIEPLGQHTIQLNDTEYTNFISLIQSSNLSQYKSEYRGYMTDLPTTKIHFLKKGTVYKIMDYANSPTSLKKFEKEVESLIYSIKWN